MDADRVIPHWIDGHSTAGTSERTAPVFNPATGQVSAQVVLGSEKDVDTAVEAAQRAFPDWRQTPSLHRARILFGFREALLEHREEFAQIISNEHGKSLDDARGEVTRGMEVVEFACGIPHLIKGESSEDVSRGVDTTTVRQPLGVVAGITPFNFPSMVPMWMFPVAIACGNTFVLKPSERDPSAAAFMAELLQQAGLPDGVFNVVNGDKTAVDAILDHPRVAAVSFVGSTPIARHVYERASTAGKRVQALGGAKNHAVVMPDANLDEATRTLVGAVYGSTGQRCMAVSAVIAVGDIADDLVDRLRDTASDLRVGPADDPQTEMGPLVTAQARDRVVDAIEGGVTEGATLALDGRDVEVDGHEGGFFIGPTILDHVTPEMAAYREEIFGPVMSVVRVDTFDNALKLVSENPYGNGAAIYTADGRTARRFQHEVQAGMVGINVPIPVPMAYYSFGGWKDSLFGDTHIHGPEGIHFYTQGKVITSRWFDDPDKGVELGFPTSQ